MKPSDREADERWPWKHVQPFRAGILGPYRVQPRNAHDNFDF